MFGTEFQLSDDPYDVVIMFYLVLPVGFTGPPGISGRPMEGVQQYRRLFAPQNTLRDASMRLQAEVFVDDGMFLEPNLGQRMDFPTHAWGYGADLILGMRAIIKEKLATEGTWGKQLILLGYHVDIEEDTISLHDPQIIGATKLIQSPEFNPGCRTLNLHAAQALRGCVNHWSETGHFRQWLTEPINQLLGSADSNNIWIR